MIADALLVLVVGISTQAQRPVVDIANTAKGPSKKLLLLGCGVKPILIGSLLFHAEMIADNVSACQVFPTPPSPKHGRALSSRPLKGGGSSRPGLIRWD